MNYISRFREICSRWATQKMVKFKPMDLRAESCAMEGDVA